MRGLDVSSVCLGLKGHLHSKEMDGLLGHSLTSYIPCPRRL